MTTTIEDPIVEKMRNVRRDLAARFGDDINALCDFLANEESKHEERLVNHPAKKPQVAMRSR